MITFISIITLSMPLPNGCRVGAAPYPHPRAYHRSTEKQWGGHGDPASPQPMELKKKLNIDRGLGSGMESNKIYINR